MSKLNNKFVILTAFYNCEDYIARNVIGTLKQGTNDLGVIFINDGSQDDSEEILFDQITGSFGGDIQQSGSSNVWTGKAFGKDILYVKHEQNSGCAGLNQKVAVDRYVSNTDTICGIVDGDDFLNDNGAVAWVTEKMGSDKLLYASTQRWKRAEGGSKDCYYLSNKLLTQADFPDFVVGGVTFSGHKCLPLRSQTFRLNHFRAFRKILSDNVETGRSFVNPTGGLMKAGSDVAFFKPMIDMAEPDRIEISRACHYSYTYDSPLNDHNLYHDDQHRNAKFCHYSIKNVDFVSGSTGHVAQWCLDRGVSYGHVSGNDVNLSGVVDGKTGYFFWNKYPETGSVTCSTPYNRINW